MKYIEWVDKFPASIAPPSYIENLTGAAFTLLLLLFVFTVIGFVAQCFIWLWDWREARRARKRKRYPLYRGVL